MNRIEAIAAVEALVPWGAPREVPTKHGPRMLRKAPVSEAFWTAWRVGKAQLKELGVSVGKDDFKGTGEWEACWWQEVPHDIVEKRAAAVESSRATDAEIDVPCPEGLAYMPFQRAGIRFALGKFGLLDKLGMSACATEAACGKDKTTEQKKGGMPIPSRGDSCGVLIADEMG